MGITYLWQRVLIYKFYMDNMGTLEFPGAKRDWHWSAGCKDTRDTTSRKEVLVLGALIRGDVVGRYDIILKRVKLNIPRQLVQCQP